ncbi:MAG: metallophosphoesterase family protein [Bacteroidales bacterium]|nr:metallophosphoesterase family protein [Bacteroidales bacterium]
MKKHLSFLLCPALAVLALLALTGARPPRTLDIPVTDHMYSISTGPGEDASNAMCISWSSDTTAGSTFVRITETRDRKWKKAFDIAPTAERRYDIFKGMYSKMADGTNFYEDAVFSKYGTTVYGLKPDTDYQYVIVEMDGDQTVGRSAAHTFRTAGAKHWSACIISDFHSYPPLPHRLEVAMAMIDTMQRFDPSLDWVLSPGDVVAWGGSYSFWRRMFEEDNFNEFLWARVNGNHDNWTRQSQVSHDFSSPSEFFTGTSWYPQNGYAGETGVCYHFRYGNTLFVMLNSEDARSKEELAAAQAWLRDCVRAARAGANPPTYVVVCMHYEWFGGTNGKSVQYKRWHEVFDELGVDLAVAGNNHVYVRSLPLYEDQVTDGTSGTVYIQTSSCDDDRGRDIPDEPMQNPDKIAFRWTEGSHSVSAIHMDVNDERIVLTLLDRHGHAVDSTVVPAKKR